MKIRALAVVALAITMPFAATACGADSTGELDKGDLVDELKKAGLDEETADCAADAMIDADFTKDELDNIALESNRTIDIDQFVPRDEIDELYVVPELRGQGIGRALMEATLARARAANAVWIEVTTGEKPHAPAWTLVLVKEYWWNIATGAAIKTTQWAHVRKGRRADVIAWLRREQHGRV